MCMCNKLSLYIYICVNISKNFDTNYSKNIYFYYGIFSKY